MIDRSRSQSARGRWALHAFRACGPVYTQARPKAVPNSLVCVRCWQVFYPDRIEGMGSVNHVKTSAGKEYQISSARQRGAKSVKRHP